MRAPLTSAALLLGLATIVLPTNASELRLKSEEISDTLRSAVEREAPRSRIRSARKFTDGPDAAKFGHVYYQIEVKTPEGKTPAYVLAEDGALVATLEENVALVDVPDAVRASMEKHAGGGIIKRIYRLDHKGSVLYGFTVEGKTSLKMNPQGELITEK